MKRRLIHQTVLLLVIAAFAPGCRRIAESGEDTQSALPSQAEPLDVRGCSNLYKINEHLYRGAQCTAEGFVELEKLGIRTVLNLRKAHSDGKLLEGTGLDCVEIEMEAWDPEYALVKQALQIIGDLEKRPVFVHCQHGADRTGTVIAAWRVAFDGWTKEEAVREMTKGPFGFHEVWVMLPRFIRRLDVEKLQSELDMQAFR